MAAQSRNLTPDSKQAYPSKSLNLHVIAMNSCNQDHIPKINNCLPNSQDDDICSKILGDYNNPKSSDKMLVWLLDQLPASPDTGGDRLSVHPQLPTETREGVDNREDSPTGMRCNSDVSDQCRSCQVEYHFRKTNSEEFCEKCPSPARESDTSSSKNSAMRMATEQHQDEDVINEATPITMTKDDRFPMKFLLRFQSSHLVTMMREMQTF